MSDGKTGRRPRTGKVIRVRVSEHVFSVYLPALQARYKLDRQLAGGMALEAAADHRILLDTPPTEPPPA